MAHLLIQNRVKHVHMFEVRTIVESIVIFFF